MKVLFFYPGIIYAEEQPLGLMYLSSRLKSLNIETSLFDLTFIKKNKFGDPETSGKRAFVEHFKSFSPDIVLFSVCSPFINKSLAYARLVKEISDVPVFLGGAHPTVDPENTISRPEVDFVCVGEGDNAIRVFFKRLLSNQNLAGIDNIWIKQGGQITKPAKVQMVKDIDALPFPDRELLKEHFDRGLDVVSFVTSRGCPMKCSYCHNPFLQELYKGQGSYVRFHSVDRVITEIDETLRKYPLKGLTFSDDMFTVKKERVVELCKYLKNEVRLPFSCQTHVQYCDMDLFKILKEAGCIMVSMGIESGNEYIRTKVFKRSVSNDDIQKAFDMANSVGLTTGSFNILGAPGETAETLWDTIEINRNAKPKYLNYTILMPFKGSPIRNVFEKNGWLAKETSESYYYDSIISLPTISSRALVAYLRTFAAYVKWPKTLYPIIHFARYLWFCFPRSTFFILRFFQKFIVGPYHRIVAKFA